MSVSVSIFGIVASNKIASLANGNLVVIGDSISAASGSPAGTTNYPVLIGNANPTMTLHDQAVSGQRAYEMAAAMSTQIDPFFNSGKPYNALVLFCGANDIALDLHDAPTVYSSVTTIVSHAKGLGFKVIVCTCTDLVLDGTQEQDLLLPYNDLIRANSAGAHAIAECFNTLGPNNGSPRPTNFFDDLHPSQTGQNLLKPVVTNAILSVI